MKEKLRLLIVEDSELDAGLMESEIRRHGYEILSHRIETRKDLRAALELRAWDLILCDYHIPDFNALEALQIFKGHDIDIPFIVVSGATGEEVGVNAVKAGADDYVMKGNLKRLVPAIERELRQAAIRRDRKKADEALKNSEERLRILFEYAPDAYYLSDLRGTFVDSNKAAENLTGFPRNELIGRNFLKLNLLSPVDLLRAAGLLGQNALGRPTGPDEFMLRRRDGIEVEVEIRTFPVKLQEQLLVLGIARDVSEGKRAEVALRASEEKYRKLFEESKEPAYLSSYDGKFLDINLAGVELFGYNRKEELIGMDLLANLYVDPQRRDDFRRRIDQDGYVKDFEVKLKRKDGGILTVFDTATPVRDERGTTIIYRGTLRDVTLQRDLEQQLLQAQKLASIGTLADGIAHDFNNILSIILSHCTFLQRATPSPEDLAQSLEVISRSVERGAGVVRQLLTFASTTGIKFEPMDSKRIIEEVSEMLEETFPKNITFMLDLEKDLPPINADVTQFHQAVMNICINARDAMPSGGIISISLRDIPGTGIRNLFPEAKSGKYLHLSIADTGVGMDESTKARIFDPFFTTKEIDKGTGLGLAVVYGVVKGHNGFIRVESESNHGSVFHLYFPIVAGGKPVADEKVPRAKETIGGNESLLFVEDEETVQKMVNLALKDKGYDVLLASDGLQAVDLYRRNEAKISLVILNLGLPKLSGFEVLTRLKELNPKVKVIVASGYSMSDMKSRILKAGAKEFIQKPYDPNLILTKVREILDTTN
jgi:two-component system cell cycle sensor histidine kinase/response regulator CckA